MSTTKRSGSTAGGEDIRTRHMKRQKKKRKRRIFIRSLLLLLLLAAVCGILLFLTPWFNIVQISVEGNSQVQTDAITAQSEIYSGANIFKVSTSYAREKISQMPYIKSVEVRRKLPNKIIIEIQESHAAACMANAGGYVIIDEDGKVLEIVQEAPSGCMQIVGCELKEFKLGQKIKVDSDEKFDIIILCIDEFEKNALSGAVNTLDITNTVDIKFTYENRLTVFCGEAENLYRKLLTFNEIAFNQLSPNARGEIDLRIDGKSYYRP